MPIEYSIIKCWLSVLKRFNEWLVEDKSLTMDDANLSIEESIKVVDDHMLIFHRSSCVFDCIN